MHLFYNFIIKGLHKVPPSLLRILVFSAQNASDRRPMKLLVFCTVLLCHVLCIIGRSSGTFDTAGVCCTENSLET